MIDDEIIRFIEGPVAIIVATHDGAQPASVRGYAASATSNWVTIHLPRRHATLALNHIDVNGDVAAVFSRVTDFETVQIKGTDARVDRGEPDSLRLQTYCEAFLRELVHTGLSQDASGGLRFRDFVAVSFVPTAVFRQTPGPSAGTVIRGRDG